MNVPLGSALNPRRQFLEAPSSRRPTRLHRYTALPLRSPRMSPIRDAWRHRPTHRRVWGLAAPMILSNVSVPLVALVDSTVVGHLPHAHQLGAVAVGATLFTFMVGLMGFLRMG